MKLSNTTCTISENVTQVTETSNNNIIVNEVQEDTKLNLDIKISEVGAESYITTSHNHMESTNVQSAIQELADIIKVQDSIPLNYEQGDLWYDSDDNQLKVAREIGDVLQFVPLLSGTGNSDTVSGGTFV